MAPGFSSLNKDVTWGPDEVGEHPLTQLVTSNRRLEAPCPAPWPRPCPWGERRDSPLWVKALGQRIFPAVLWSSRLSACA